MTKRPILKPAVKAREFKETLAEMARDLASWIELSVTAFPADTKARDERLAKIARPDGFRFFLETYLPHYVRGAHSLFHLAIFDRVPVILSGDKGAREMFVAPRGLSKSTHLSLGFALYCIVLGKKRYILEVCDVYAQSALLIEAIKAELTTNPRLQHDFPKLFGAGRVLARGRDRHAKQYPA